MRAFCPATGAAYIFEADSDVARSHFGFLCTFYPINPFVTRERCDVEPERHCFCIGLDSGLEIFWKSVY